MPLYEPFAICLPFEANSAFKNGKNKPQTNPNNNNNTKRPYRKENCEHRTTIKYTSPTWGIPQAHPAPLGRRSDRPPQTRSRRVGSSRLHCRTLPRGAPAEREGAGGAAAPAAAKGAAHSIPASAARQALPALPYSAAAAFSCPGALRSPAGAGASPQPRTAITCPAPLSPAPHRYHLPPRRSSGGSREVPGRGTGSTAPLPVLPRSRLIARPPAGAGPYRSGAG